MIVKFCLAACFVFNKDGGTTQYLVHLALSAISIYIVYKRVTEAVLFERSVYNATLYYEAL